MKVIFCIAIVSYYLYFKLIKFSILREKYNKFLKNYDKRVESCRYILVDQKYNAVVLLTYSRLFFFIDEETTFVDG